MGLCLIVSATGKKTWRYRRRIARSGAIVTLTLGTYPAYTIPMAREWANELNQAIECGEDPREAIRAEKARESLTVEKVHTIYMDVLRRGERKQLKPHTLYDKEVIFTRDIKPRLGKKLLLDLTENECWDAVYDKAKASKVRANKMAGQLSCFLRWCAGREGRMAGIELAAHPAPTLNSNWFCTGPQANTRFLNDEELEWLFRALCDEELTYRRGFILLLLTAARRNELFGASSVEIADGVWTLPPERSKNNQENVVALGPWGRRLARTNYEWLFPSPRIDGPQFYGWFKARDRIHARMEEFAGREIASWHFHDFRRTFRSNACRLGIDRDIAELMLNHKKKGLEAVYDTNEELDLRAQGFAAWETFLLSIASAAGVADKLDGPAVISVQTRLKKRRDRRRAKPRVPDARKALTVPARVRPAIAVR
ncbi:tyrosine-type recombinase/integrase [Altericroceibacterium spongiae]|uniref:tyrosine-type recombinase/integrase n=1 Tax=Altericroceibacterium spongiae TaxID=2320269 RepID=UPI0016023358|nr:integrase family protein [Altericroceibacterium spongiae]